MKHPRKSVPRSQRAGSAYFRKLPPVRRRSIALSRLAGSEYFRGQVRRKRARSAVQNPSIALKTTRGPAGDRLRAKYRRMSRATKKLFRRGAVGADNIKFFVQVRRGSGWESLARFASKAAARQYGQMMAASYPSQTFQLFWR